MKQTTEGKIRVWTRQGTPHCGPNSGYVEIQYRVELFFARYLDAANRFMIDNGWIAQYFRDLSLVHLGVSCETLAELICRDFSQAAGGNASVETYLSAVPGVWVSSFSPIPAALTVASTIGDLV